MFNCSRIPTDVDYASQFWAYYIKGWRQGVVGPCKPEKAFDLIAREIILPVEKEDVKIVALNKFNDLTLLPQEEGIAGYNL